LPTSAIGIVVGLAAEARIAWRLTANVLCAASRPEVAARHAAALIADGATTLMSIGIAGGLAPGLKSGAIVVATEIITDGATYPAIADCGERAKAHIGPIYGGNRIVASVSEKAELASRTGALAVDLESGPVAAAAAAAGIPFIAIRAIADTATRTLPPAALLPLDERGEPRLAAVLWSVLMQPSQIPGLIRTGRETRTALGALERACRRLTEAGA
jgi:adenosylhomocysteine nucleosidase